MVCPTGIAAVIFGLAIAEALGVSDLVAGIWIGSVVAAITMFAAIKLRKKYGLIYKYQTALILLVMIVITSATAYLMTAPAQGVCGI